MMALMLSLGLIMHNIILPHPMVGKATWYGYPTRDACYDGVPRTCAPYRHGELVNYCAMKGFGFYDRPFWVTVTSVATDKTVRCLVRDACACVGGGIIDLSPAVFRQLRSLRAGIVRVRIERYIEPIGGRGR